MTKKHIWIIITVIIMVSIFLFSSQPDYKSNALSMKVTDKIVDILADQSSHKKTLTDTWNDYVRKYAHFTLFLLLGIAVYNAFRYNFINKKLIVLWGFSILFCLLYASSDEIHQIFVPGRGCLFTDVMIDFSGSIIGSLSMLGLAMMMKQKRKNAEKIMERE